MWYPREACSPAQGVQSSCRPCAQVLWECGGTLAAPAITGATIHKAMAFIAPKVVGGVRAPTPVGELGNVEMTQARHSGGRADTKGSHL